MKLHKCFFPSECRNSHKISSIKPPSYPRKTTHITNQRSDVYKLSSGVLQKKKSEGKGRGLNGSGREEMLHSSGECRLEGKASCRFLSFPLSSTFKKFKLEQQSEGEQASQPVPF
jgi:hypothetical protein